MKDSDVRSSGCGGGAKCVPTARDGELVNLCIAIGKAMFKEADRCMAAYGLTPTQFEILTILVGEGKIPLSRLSERLCCASSNVTGVVDRLERDGLVERERTNEDRRVILLGVTEKGREVHGKVPAGGCCGISFAGILDPTEEANLMRLLEKLAAGLS